MTTNPPMHPEVEAAPGPSRRTWADARPARAAQGLRRTPISRRAGASGFFRFRRFAGRSLLAVAIAAGAVLLHSEDAEGQNTRPRVQNPISDKNVLPGAKDFEVSIAGVFRDPDRNTLLIRAYLLNTGVQPNSHGCHVNVDSGETSDLPPWLELSGKGTENPAAEGEIAAKLTAATVGEAGIYWICVTAFDGVVGQGLRGDAFRIVVNTPPSVVTGMEINDQQLDPNGTISLGGLFSDADGHDLTVSGRLVNDSVEVAMVGCHQNPNADTSALPSWLVLDPDPDDDPATLDATLTAAETVGAAGTYNICAIATDELEGRVGDDFEVTVVNFPPRVANVVENQIVASGAKNFEISLAGVFADANNDTLTVAAAVLENGNPVALPDWLTVTDESTPDPKLTLVVDMTPGGAARTITIRLTATEPSGGVVTDDFDLMVVANDPPIVDTPLDNRDVGPGGEVSLGSLFSDADGDNLTVTASLVSSGVEVAMDGCHRNLDADRSDLPPWLMFDPNPDDDPATIDATLTAAETVGAAGTYKICVIASDAYNRVGSDFDIVVANISPNVANSLADQQVNSEATSFEISLAGVFADANNDTLTVAAAVLENGSPVALPDWLTVTGGATSDPKLTLAPGMTPGGAERTITIRLTATDAGGQMATDDFDLVVFTNLAPAVANPIEDQIAVPNSGGIEISLANVFSDAENDDLTITATLRGGNALPSWIVPSGDGVETPAAPSSINAKLTVTPDDSVGTYAIRVTASDGNGEMAHADFTLSVTELLAVNDVLNIDEGDVAETVNVIQGSGNDFMGRDIDLLGPENEPPMGFEVTHLWSGNASVGNVLFGSVELNPSASIAGTYGRLKMEADGTAVYTLLPDAAGLAADATDVFTYQVRKSSGAEMDFSRATLTVTITADEDDLVVKNAIGRRVFEPAAGGTFSIEIPGDAFEDPDTANPTVALTAFVVDGTNERELSGTENMEVPADARWLRFAAGPPGMITGTVPDPFAGATLQIRIKANASDTAQFTFELVVHGSTARETVDPVGAATISSVSWSIIDAIRQGLSQLPEEPEESNGFASSSSSGRGPGISFDVAPMAAFFYGETERGPIWRAEDARRHRTHDVAQAGVGAPVGGVDGLSEGRAFGFGEVLDNSGASAAFAEAETFGSGGGDVRIWANARRGALRAGEFDIASAEGIRPASDEQRTFGLGFDTALDDGLRVGVALARNVGNAGLVSTSGLGDGRNESRTVQTTVAPFMAVSGDRSRHWGAVGLGQGDLNYSREVPTRSGTTVDLEDSSEMSLRLAAVGSDYDLVRSGRVDATGRVEVLSASMTLEEARDATYARQDAALWGARGEVDLGMPVSTGNARIRPNASLGYRWESGELVYGDLAGIPGSAVSLDARTYEYGGGLSLGLSDLSMEVAYMARLTGSGQRDGYAFDASWDRRRDGTGIMASLNAAIGAGTSRSMDPFSASTLHAGPEFGTGPEGDGRGSATARAGYSVGIGRLRTMSAYAESGYGAGTLDRMAFGVDRNGALGTLGLSYKASSAAAVSNPDLRSFALEVSRRF